MLYKPMTDVYIDITFTLLACLSVDYAMVLVTGMVLDKWQRFLQARCLSCYVAYSVKALKEIPSTDPTHGRSPSVSLLPGALPGC